MSQITTITQRDSTGPKNSLIHDGAGDLCMTNVFCDGSGLETVTLGVQLWNSFSFKSCGVCESRDPLRIHFESGVLFETTYRVLGA